MRIKELILDKKEPTIYCESFVYEPSNIEEERLGNLFMVGRIRNVPENSFYLINLLASRIKREYYNLKHSSPYQAFEAAMKEGSKVLKENEERINWLGNLDFLIATADDKKIHFSLIGKMKCFVLREESIVDLVKDLIEEKDVLFPFSTILQSNLKKDDILILTTSNIFSKEVLMEEGKNLFPIDEEKIAKIINPDESGVSLMVETGETSTVVERLTPALSVLKPPMVMSKINLPQKEKLKKGVDKSKEFLKGMTEKGKESFGSKLKKISALIQRKKEKITPQIAVERMHYSNKFKMKFSKILKKKGAIAILAIVLILGVFLGIGQYKKAQQIKVIDTALAEAQEKISESENHLIYGDEEKAVLALSEGSDILEKIESNLKKEEVTKIKQEIEKKMAEISGREILTNLTPILEIEKEEIAKTDNKEWQGSNLLLDNNNLYIFAKNNSFFYQGDISKKSGNFLEQEKEIIGSAIIDEKMSFLLSPDLLVRKGLKNLQLEFPYEEISFTQNIGYLNSLYVLDSKEGEVIKYEVSNSVIKKPLLWLREREAVKETVSFSIDGSVYFLYKDGSIKRFLRGTQREEIASPKTYPKIEAATRVFTSTQNNYLYILEPKAKRIIIQDKKGNVVAEYQSNQFQDAKDILADKEDKNVYLLAQNKVFQIEIGK